MLETKTPLQTVAVVGAGYVGLPLCLQLAKAGLKVTAVDVDEGVVRAINNRVAKVEEHEDFERFFADPEVQANLDARTTPLEADAFVIAVPTPLGKDGESPDLKAVTAAAESIVPFVRPGNLVVVESTIPPLTTETVVKPILEKSGFQVGEEILLAHCPERIMPGNLMNEVVFNARVIGGITEPSTKRAAELFGRFVQGKLIFTEARTAEFVKLIENAYRDVNIAFANQIAMLCERLGIEAGEAIALANHHPRVDILKPGIGVGGHCIPVDPWFLVDTCPDLTDLLRTARHLNNAMPQRTAQQIIKAIDGIDDPKVVCLGATYKPNVRDTRESPALEVFRILQEKGLNASLFDPLLKEYFCDSVLSAARGCDALIILVPHDLIVTEIQYRKQEILAAMRRPNLLSFTPGVL